MNQMIKWRHVLLEGYFTQICNSKSAGEKNHVYLLLRSFNIQNIFLLLLRNGKHVWKFIDYLGSLVKRGRSMAQKDLITVGNKFLVPQEVSICFAFFFLAFLRMLNIGTKAFLNLNLDFSALSVSWLIIFLVKSISSNTIKCQRRLLIK